MNKTAEKPDWTEYPSMVRFYEQAQAAELKTGSVRNVVRELQDGTCTFVNGSLERLKALDPEAAKKRTGFWRFMCDLSLY